MLHVGIDALDKIGSFNTQIKTDRNGGVFAYGYATSGSVLKTPYFLLWHGSGYAATALAASTKGQIGVAIAAIASGCVGWFQIRGFCSDVQGAATKLKGSFGHAVYFSAAGVAASASAFIGIDSQFAVLAEDVGGGASTTANMWLIGRDSNSPLA